MNRTERLLTILGIVIALLFSTSALYQTSQIKAAPAQVSQIWAQPTDWTDAGLAAFQKANPNYIGTGGPDYASGKTNTIDKLIAMGGRRWTKYGLDRVYFRKPGIVGAVYWDSKTGEFTGPNTPDAAQLIATLRASIR